MALSALLSGEQELSRGHSVIRGNSWCRSQPQHQPPTAIKGLLMLFHKEQYLSQLCNHVQHHNFPCLFMC